MKHFIIYFMIVMIMFSCGADEEEMMNPSLPTINIIDVQDFESDDDKVFPVEVTIRGKRDGQVSVDFNTVDGTAIGGEDYQAVSGTLTFAPADDSKTIEITIIGDDEVEETESFTTELRNAVQAVILRSSATISIINDDAEVVNIDVEIPTAGYISADSYEGMDLVWSDEFQEDELDLESWTHEIGDGCPNICGWGNNELEYYQPANTAVVDGEYLVIEAREEKAGNRNYTSSRIISKGKREFQHARIDVRAVLPKGQGIWPAIWMLGANIDQAGWPACGEIDIMEIIGNEPARLHGTAHWQNANNNYASYGQYKDLQSGDFSEEFHVFSILWDQNNIKWLLDDVQFNIMDTSPGDLSEFRNPFFFIFNIAVGGNWPGSPDESTVFPQHMIIDYVRVFQTN